jgi:hypothetical protein
MMILGGEGSAARAPVSLLNGFANAAAGSASAASFRKSRLLRSAIKNLN